MGDMIPHMTKRFVQVIHAPAGDRDGLQQAWASWHDAYSAGAEGWLGSDSGITDDGTFVAVVQFVSREAADRNAQRPEQDGWWRDFAQHLRGEATFHNCEQVAVYGEDRPDQVGFVHIVQGRSTELNRVVTEAPEVEHHHISEHRLSVLGGLVAAHGDGGFTEVIYFPSEETAREGETGQIARQGITFVERMTSHMEDVRHFELRDPWLQRH